MKKIIALLLIVVLGMSLVACGGEEKKDTAPDKQPTIDKFNETSNKFNAVAADINANIEMFDEEVITTMTDMANLLNEYKDLLSGNDEIAQEDLDAMIEWLGEVDAWVEALEAELEGVL